MVSVKDLGITGLQSNTSPLQPAAAASTPSIKPSAMERDPAAQQTIGITAVPAIERQIDVLLGGLSLEEKIGQFDCRNAGECTGPSIQGHPTTVEEAVRLGRVGSILNCDNPEEVVRLQRIARESPAGIPPLFALDILAGLKTLGPGPLFLGGTMSEEDAYAAGRVAAQELKAVLGPSMTYAANVDDHTSAKNGRIVEAHGAAPHLNGVMAAAWIKGFQSVPGMVACAKHWLGYGHADFGLDYRAATASPQQIEDDLKPPFYSAFAAGVPAVMVAFQALNGVPMHKNAAVNKELAARGLVVISDWAAGGELIKQGVAKDTKEAALLMWRAGITLDMMSGVYSNHLKELVEEGSISAREIDERLRPLLRLKLRMGLFDHPFPEPGAMARDIHTQEKRAIMEGIAERSMVLLKNGAVGGRPILPLAKEAKTIALLGPLAKENPGALCGWWKGRAEDPHITTVHRALTERAAASGQKVLYAEGCHVMPPNPNESDEKIAAIEAANKELIQDAVAKAKKADLAVVVLGETPQMSGEGAVRLSPDLPEPQRELLKALHAAGVPVVLVLETGRPLTSLDWAKRHIDGILLAGQPGTEGGRAIVSTLYGCREDGTTVNPGGKLTAEWDPTPGAVGALSHRRLPSGRPGDDALAEWRHSDTTKDGAFNEHGVMVDDPAWRGGTFAPTFSFGYGLSYTQFELGAPLLSTTTIGLSELRRRGITVRVPVTNTGDRAGDQTLQIYVRKSVADTVQPMLRLRAFQRVTLAPGETKEVELKLDPESFKYYSEARKRRVSDPGEYKIWVGTSAAAEDLQLAKLDVVEKVEAVGGTGRAWELR